MNQNLAATLGLWCAFRITGEARWKNAALAKYHKLAQAPAPKDGSRNTEEQIWATVRLRSICWQAPTNGGARVAAMAEGLCRFLVQMQGRDGGFPGRIGSRGTSHAFPFGADFAARFGDAATLARGFRAGYRADLLTAPSQTDDRYFAYFYFPQFAQAHALAARSRNDLVPVPHSERSAPEEIHLANSGLRSSGSGETLHVSRRLGGAIAVSREGERCAYHLGYEITTEDGRRFVSATWDDGELPSDHECSAGRFRAVSEGLPLVHLMVPFAIFVRLLAFTRASARFSDMIKRKLVRPAREIPVTLVRRVGRMVPASS